MTLLEALERYGRHDFKCDWQRESYTSHTQAHDIGSGEAGSEGLGSRRLWSLWDMIQFDLPAMIELSREMGRLVRHMKEHDQSKTLQDHTKDSYRTNIEEQKVKLYEIGLHMCSIQCDRILDSLDKTVGEIGNKMNELFFRLLDECSLRKFLCITNKESNYAFPNAPLFGVEFDKKFPTCSFELEEAGKCFGFGRSTASVFHLMRIMEIGILATARCISIPDPIKPSERNWGVMLGQKIKPELDDRTAKRDSKIWAITGDKQLFEDVYASLDAVRAAWRNTTMHIENKYNEEEAEHIFIAVKGFMKKLASRMDESGEPKA